MALTFDSNLTTYMLKELRTGTVRSFVNKRVIDELDWDGWTGCEYRPAAQTSGGLGWLRRARAAPPR